MTEFDVIKKYFTRDYKRPDIVMGVGDDAAIVVAPPGQLVLTLDTLVAGVHFFADTPPYDIGFKTAAVNLSDLAAMGAKPLWATLALTVPQIDEHWLNEFSRGLFALLDRYQVALIGGDTTRGPLAITLQAHGNVPTGKALRRDTAQNGDLIYVSGTLGDAGFALKSRYEKILLPATAENFLLERLNRPTSRLELGMALNNIAHAAIDISDGFAQDLQHILTRSKVGAEIELNNLPLSPVLTNNLATDLAYQLALTGGDDYELCFTAPTSQGATIKDIANALGCAITCVGKITAGLELRLMKAGQTIEWDLTGYQHFK